MWMKSLFLTILLVGSAPVQAADVGVLDGDVVLSRADVLQIYSAIVSDSLGDVLSRNAQLSMTIQEMEMTLADANGRVHLDVMLTIPVARHLQKTPPAEQMAAVASMREAFADMILSLGERSDGQAGMFNNIPVARSSSDASLGKYMASITRSDVVVNIGFLFEGDAKLYASATAQGVQFAPDAPTIP